MRKANAILTALILLLFLLHAILGSFLLTGLGQTALKRLARANIMLIAIHMLIGLKLTVDTLKAQKKAGRAYVRENLLFWARRVSGLAVMVFIILHMGAFTVQTAQGVRLASFTGFRFAAQLLLVASLALHILSNVKPILIAFGIRSQKRHAGDILFVLSVLLLLMGAAFIVYYLRWVRY